MGKGKLAKFADMAEYPHVFEYPYSQVADAPCEMKGGHQGSAYVDGSQAGS